MTVSVSKYKTTKAPFPYFGGKSSIAGQVWRLLGDVPNYVEPFFGSGAVLLSRPHKEPGTETVNDINGYVANFWRAIQHEPEAVAEWADNPVNENDLHARHVWLVKQKESLRAHLEGDPDWYDAQVAGWWCWGICCWIGGGWCDGVKGPWWTVDGKLVHLGDKGQGVKRQRVHLGNNGRGVNRKRVHLGNNGKGVNRKLVHLNKGQGVNRQHDGLIEWFNDLASRLRNVRVCCGDWSRVCGDVPTIIHGTTGVFLDPPYLLETADGKKRDDVYGENDCGQVAHDVREWCLERGDNPKFRIVLCGYEGEHDMPGWRVRQWKTGGGYGKQGSNGTKNANRERLWISPHCQTEVLQRGLFG